MRRRTPAPLLLALVIHLAAAYALVHVVFHYDFSAPPAPERIVLPVERVTYVAVGASAAGGSDSSSAPAARAAAAAPLLSPPRRIPPAVAPGAPTLGGAGTSRSAAGGRGTGGAAPTTGIVPGERDPRLATDPHYFDPEPKTHAERVDSAVKASIYAYNDSVARANAGRRDPRDWTVERNGQKWGIDGSRIYLGRFAIPSAVLAALPIRIQANPGESLNDRLVSSRRADLVEHSAARFHDEEFNTAVRRIRERKDRERRERRERPSERPASTGAP